MSRDIIFILCFVSAVTALPQSSDDEWSSGLYEYIENNNAPKDENDELSPLFFGSSDTDDLIVHFMLYTRDAAKNYTKIVPGNEETLRNVDITKDLKLIIHGWRNGYDSPLGEILKEAYLKIYDVNVIVLDWSSRSFKNYVGSRISVPAVGRQVAALLDDLVKVGLSLDKIHMVGHSLGAHVAGVAGSSMRSGKVARITGLDPAAPMFSITEIDMLKSSCAQFVDVIHTCGYVLGLMAPLGHADFYPNKGTPPQPGCGLDFKGECSHSRAYELFAESINPYNRMLAIQCEDAAAFDESKCSATPPILMGEHTPSTARGLYFLITNRRPLYGKGHPK